MIPVYYTFTLGVQPFPARSLWFVYRQSDVRFPGNLQRGADGTDGHRVANDVQHASRTRARIRHAAVLLDGMHPVVHGGRRAG